MSFGGLHTDHRGIVAAASIVFLVLTLVMAVLPGLRTSVAFFSVRVR